MALTINDYKTICQMVGASPINDNAYKYCDKIYRDYLNTIVIPNLNGKDYGEMVFLYLESAPGNITNYIFDNLNSDILFENDSYLWNISNGFDVTTQNNRTKKDCLIDLVNYQTKDRRNIPVIVMDLFPFHGIQLTGAIRRKICENIAHPSLFADVNSYKNLIPDIDKKSILLLFGVPYTIWNFAGGYGPGSLYADSHNAKNGLLGKFTNRSVVVNVGGQNISSTAINSWRIIEGID